MEEKDKSKRDVELQGGGGGETDEEELRIEG